MAWKFDNPLHSMTTEDQNVKARDTWEGESLGGIMEDNNRLPQPIVVLMALTILTAFLITAPLWGQRPTAAIYAEYISIMDSSEVQAIQDDAGKMDFIVSKVKSSGSKYEALQDRHPLEMDDLRVIKDQVVELQKADADLEEYSIIGGQVVLANFEGNMKPDGSRREAKQPNWDKGYTIDIFYVLYFCIAIFIAIKRLPNHKWMPDHSKAH